MRITMRYIYLMFLLGAFASCKKYLDINDNPNSPVEAPINGLLTRATQNAALNVYRVANITSYYAIPGVAKYCFAYRCLRTH
jgi:hypothetical protein